MKTDDDVDVWTPLLVLHSAKVAPICSRYMYMYIYIDRYRYMHHTALWNVYIHGLLFSGRVIITDAVGVQSYRVSPINVLLDTFSPRPSLATNTVMRI